MFKIIVVIILAFVFIIFINTTYSQSNCDWQKSVTLWPTPSIGIPMYFIIGTPNSWLTDFNNAFSYMGFRGGTSIQYASVGGAPANVTTPTPKNNRNEYGVGSLSPITLAQTKTTVVAGTTSEVDITVNTQNNSFTWGLPNGVDEESTVRHELGHCYGLRENYSGCTLMQGGSGGVTLVWVTCCDDALHCLYFNDAFCDRVTFPIILSDASAKNEEGKLKIRWTCEQQVGFLGFEILRSNDGGSVFEFVKVNNSLVEMKGDELLEESYEFTDNTADIRNSYWYTVQILTLNGEIEEEPFFYEGQGTN